MTATAFDTLAYAKKLKEAGISESQAEALAAALREGETLAVGVDEESGCQRQCTADGRLGSIEAKKDGCSPGTAPLGSPCAGRR